MHTYYIFRIQKPISLFDLLFLAYHVTLIILSYWNKGGCSGHSALHSSIFVPSMGSYGG